MWSNGFEPDNPAGKPPSMDMRFQQKKNISTLITDQMKGPIAIDGVQ